MSIARVNTDYLIGTADAIRRKTGSQEAIPLPQFESEIDNIPTGGGVKTKKVNFYDFKGNLTHSYTAEEAVELTEMPEAPIIEDFTFQKWNWSLASIKTWLIKHENDNCDLNVGSLYVTTDGHTRIYMHLREAELASLEMPFCIGAMKGVIVINWGDGSNPETITSTGTYSHLWHVDEYPANVIIDIDYTPSGLTKLGLGTTNINLFNGDKYFSSCVEKIELGNNITSHNRFAIFKDCIHLKTINIPFEYGNIETYSFQNCYDIKAIVLPNNGNITVQDSAFENCVNLVLISLSENIVSIKNSVFHNCYNLALTSLPDSITSIGNYSFQYCYNITLTSLPENIISIGNAAFQYCYNIVLASLPESITSIGDGAFQYCYNITLTSLPESITSIRNYSFYNCVHIKKFIFSNDIINIGDSAFTNCLLLYIIDLTAFTDPQSIPKLANRNVFQGIPPQAQFWVENQEMYDAFTTATNWSTYTSKFVIKGA